MRRILFLLAALALAAHGQMAEVLKNQYHNEKELGVALVTEKDPEGWKKAIADPNTRLLCLQLGPEQVKVADAEAMLKWVRSGKSLWFYDARLGPLFGFKPYLLTRKQFPNKEEEGEYSGSKRQGLATVPMALRQHEVLTGVGQVSIFMIPLPEGNFGAMYVEGDTIPLLQGTLDAPAMAAMRWDGRGVIVFKPLCWPEVLSGDRFQANLLEWCAGFQIPGPAGSDKLGDPPGPNHAYVTGSPAVPLLTPPAPVAAATPGATPPPAASPTPAVRSGQDKLIGKDGTLVGNVMTESFRFETGNSSVTLKREDIKSLVIGGMDLDQLTTWDGTTRRGMLMTQKIEFEVDKDVRTYPKRDIQRLDLAPSK